jgi:hypothetical protein
MTRRYEVRVLVEFSEDPENRADASDAARLVEEALSKVWGEVSFEFGDARRNWSSYEIQSVNPAFPLNTLVR